MRPPPPARPVVTAEGGDAGANNFYKDGNTIKCPNAKVGDQGTVDGVDVHQARPLGVV